MLPAPAGVPVERFVGIGFVRPFTERPVSGVWASVFSRPVPPTLGFGEAARLRAAGRAVFRVFFVVFFVAVAFRRAAGDDFVAVALRRVVATFRRALFAPLALGDLRLGP